MVARVCPGFDEAYVTEIWVSRSRKRLGCYELYKQRGFCF
jgi:hypothetical protein